MQSDMNSGSKKTTYRVTWTHLIGVTPVPQGLHSMSLSTSWFSASSALNSTREHRSSEHRHSFSVDVSHKDYAHTVEHATRGTNHLPKFAARCGIATAIAKIQIASSITANQKEKLFHTSTSRLHSWTFSARSRTSVPPATGQNRKLSGQDIGGLMEMTTRSNDTRRTTLSSAA